MGGGISESDWKVFRQVRDLALARYCQRVLTEVVDISSDESKSSHERYLAVFKLIQDRDRELARAFDGVRRSAAWNQLASIRAMKLMTDEELARFGPVTRDIVGRYFSG